MDQQEPIRRARQILDHAYTTPITIAQLSHEVAFSQYYLIRLFRRVYKQTPHQYLMQLRIGRAKELLIRSDRSITEICADVGYESLGSFSTQFCKTVGIPPSTYRTSGQTIRNSAYIPLCACVMHGLNDTPDS